MNKRHPIIAWVGQAVGYTPTAGVTHFASAGSTKSAAAAKAKAREKLLGARPGAQIRNLDSEPIREGD